MYRGGGLRITARMSLNGIICVGWTPSAYLYLVLSLLREARLGHTRSVNTLRSSSSLHGTPTAQRVPARNPPAPSCHPPPEVSAPDPEAPPPYPRRKHPSAPPARHLSPPNSQADRDRGRQRHWTAACLTRSMKGPTTCFRRHTAASRALLAALISTHWRRTSRLGWPTSSAAGLIGHPLFLPLYTASHDARLPAARAGECGKGHPQPPRLTRPDMESREGSVGLADLVPPGWNDTR